jgi:arylsulfatase A-like enzyme
MTAVSLYVNAAAESLTFVKGILLSQLPVDMRAEASNPATPRPLTGTMDGDRKAGFRATAVLLWFRQMGLAILAFVFCEAVYLASGKAQSWAYYLPLWEVMFEALVRLVFVALAGILLGTVATIVLMPFLWYFHLSRERFVDVATKVSVFVVLFLVSRYMLITLIGWSYQLADHRRMFDVLLLTGHALAFALLLCIPRARNEVVTSLDHYLSKKMTRRTAIATVGGAAALVATEFVLARKAPVVRAAVFPERPKSNFLLITFDALSAEDMSLYGYHLPTTPYLDAFAKSGTVFTNFFSCSTFTTPGLGSVLTGMYPTENHLYHLSAQASSKNANKSLPHVLRAAGYATGAFVSNPLGYYLANSLKDAFDVLPEPQFCDGAVQDIWNGTRPLHQDTGVGRRVDEYLELTKMWSILHRLPPNLPFRFRPAATFAEARKVLDTLPTGFFLWVHVLTPHDPYIPDAADRGRFIADSELRTFEAIPEEQWKPHYKADQQKLVDRHRLGYDEFLATADRAFGAFMSDLNTSGKLQNTTVIVSADHGESFEGGVYQHFNASQTRPLLHVPLIIRRPGQQDGYKIAFTADQTALAPTILELAGVAKPEWMRGQSLVSWLNRNGQGEGEGVAFTQFLESNSVFQPLRHGTMGVIDGSYQYELELATKKGRLRPLKEGQVWNLDRSAEHPERAEALRAAIYARFPEIQ